MCHYTWGTEIEFMVGVKSWAIAVSIWANVESMAQSPTSQINDLAKRTVQSRILK